ncbi:glycosyltransferase family 39 protein [Microcoleus sp. FACHB-672]|uniref:glycosyltransferase family 39 protein n=1 Tax=Microcoleus sp. FACHB-672 TaxID=2692825 RepID=UPI00168203A0|nr:glycosyltransferase family 39 protein [Microcoleus sp. FACHB-672]MBD2039343.1 glycosyltransferase family 39 protein [Microcoleus sp. FACHB-672]
MRFFQHYLALAGVIALGGVLRFAQLDFKSLWLDEVITALFSLGRNYYDIPLDAVFQLEQLKEIFTLNPETTCSQISHNIAIQSTHPPLFFCLMHRWLIWLNQFNWLFASDGNWELAWQLRSLPAFFGVASIAAVYWLNRLAFSPTAGLISAAVMAVSPYGVYLSQEARHYTLPVLLITLALVALMIIQQDFEKRQRSRPIVWAIWVIINTIGLYVHYFFIFALIAQPLVLIFNVNSPNKNKKYKLQNSLFFGLLPFALFIPWLPILIGHFGRSETNWLPQPHNIAPLYQTLAGWLTMVVMLPVEKQPLWIIIPAGFFMLVFGLGMGWLFFAGLKKLWNNSETQPATRSLLSFTLWVLLAFLAIVYLLNKDITIAPRYHFVYYPAFCALLGASLWKMQKARAEMLKEKPLTRWAAPFTLLFVGIISCLCVTSDLAFKKPFHPQRVGLDMNLEPAISRLVVVAYKTFQDVALGVSFALEIHKHDLPENADSYMAFLQQETNYDQVWQNLSQLPLPALPLNLWVVAPELLQQQDYPQQLFALTELSTESQQIVCTIDPSHYYRVGVPYQLYRCLPAERE